LPPSSTLFPYTTLFRSKAASLHLARCLAEELGVDRIRVNTVNPDAVLEGSRIWDSTWREERARAYGIPSEELEEHYRARTTLKVDRKSTRLNSSHVAIS